MITTSLIILILIYNSQPTGSFSLKPPAEEILNTNLCPNPVLVTSSSQRPPQTQQQPPPTTISLQRFPKSRDRTYYSRFRPCTFTIDNPNDPNTTVFVRIKAINLNTKPWNYNTSKSNCTNDFIYFKDWSTYGTTYPVMCGKDNFDAYVGSYNYPMVIYYYLKSHGISFPLFHPTSYGHTNGQTYYTPHHQKSIIELTHMVIYFAVKSQGTWVCRVQQYRLDALQQHQPCGIDHEANQQICGEYDCNDLDVIYEQTLGTFDTGEPGTHTQQRFIILSTKTSEKYRVRNFLRQKFVPILFLLVIIFAYKSYMRAGLRFSSSSSDDFRGDNRGRFSSGRMRTRGSSNVRVRVPAQGCSSSVGEDSSSGFFERGGGAPPNYSDEGVVVSGKYRGGGGDLPPPSYESLFPPSYNQATTGGGGSKAGDLRV